MRVPRFAVAGMVACLVVATLAAVMVRAQSRPLWFQFAYGLKNNPRTAYPVAQTGYEDGGATMTFLNGSLVGAEMRVRVKSVSFEDVVLQIRAVPAKLEVSSKGTAMVAPDAPVSLAAAPLIHYKPGEELSVPIDGGGVLYLRGTVSDHQPKIAFGSPLEPEVGEMIVRSPTLTAQGQLIAELTGASATAGSEQPQSGILLNTKEGRFVFALTQFPGAVEGKAEWGRINFKLGDVAYQLVAAAPITGGDQPVRVWVRRDEADGDRESIGSGPI